MNHPTKLTVVWGKPDFAVIFPRTNHHTALHVRMGLAPINDVYWMSYNQTKYIVNQKFKGTSLPHIKTHDSESRGQEEAQQRDH